MSKRVKIFIFTKKQKTITTITFNNNNKNNNNNNNQNIRKTRKVINSSPPSAFKLAGTAVCLRRKLYKN
jgi:hypothetical protein